jgi:hypothetical protein
MAVQVAWRRRSYQVHCPSQTYLMSTVPAVMPLMKARCLGVAVLVEVLKEGREVLVEVGLLLVTAT